MNAGPRVTGGPQQRGCSTDLATLLGTPAGADATVPTALFSTPKALLPLPPFSNNCLSTIRQKHATVVILNCFTSILIIEITKVRTCNARKVTVQLGNIGGVFEHQGSIYGFEIFLSVSNGRQIHQIQEKNFDLVAIKMIFFESLNFSSPFLSGGNQSH